MVNFDWHEYILETNHSILSHYWKGDWKKTSGYILVPAVGIIAHYWRYRVSQSKCSQKFDSWLLRNDWTDFHLLFSRRKSGLSSFIRVFKLHNRLDRTGAKPKFVERLVKKCQEIFRGSIFSKNHNSVISCPICKIQKAISLFFLLRPFMTSVSKNLESLRPFSN